MRGFNAAAGSTHARSSTASSGLLEAAAAMRHAHSSVSTEVKGWSEFADIQTENPLEDEEGAQDPGSMPVVTFQEPGVSGDGLDGAETGKHKHAPPRRSKSTMQLLGSKLRKVKNRWACGRKGCLVRCGSMLVGAPGMVFSTEVSMIHVPGLCAHGFHAWCAVPVHGP